LVEKEASVAYFLWGEFALLNPVMQTGVRDI
jgi:hypothetical protein